MESVDSRHYDRHIRVFISSTFRDMQEDRNYLVKYTFPQLRKLCESRGVTWGEVDLRWGVTDEQAAEGKVLPICLEEIKRCRPYFIGLLGERYGWVPDSIPAELLDREPWLKEQCEGHKSVTELEILHGVLRDPKMAGHAYFYFRDPEYIKGKSSDFASEDEPSKEKLRTLKQQIRDKRFPVRENYPTPEALGELVLKDLTAVIDELYPEGSQPNPLDREAMDHEAYAASRAQVYIGRESYYRRLDEHAAGQGTGPLVVLGESGCGKSALLANWVRRYRKTHPDTLIIQHYIGASPYSADWAAMLRRIMGEFKRNLHIEDEIPNNPEELRQIFINWLHMAADGGRIILILDGLDQLEDKDEALDLDSLPYFIPRNIRLFVSTTSGRSLNDLRRRSWATLKVDPLEQTEERKQLIVEYLSQYCKALPAPYLQIITDANQTRNPLFLKVMLDEIRIFGIHERLEEQINYYLTANTISELYELILSRYEVDYERNRLGLVKEAFSLIAASKMGLSENEILDILGQDGVPLPHYIWAPLFLATEHSLISRSGLITFSHPYLRRAVRSRYLGIKEKENEAHQKLINYFQLRKLEPRTIEELLWQVTKVKDWGQLSELLTDIHVLKILIANSKQSELLIYWLKIKDSYNITHEYYKLIEKYERTNPTKEDLSFMIIKIADILCLLSDYGAESLYLRALDIRKNNPGETHQLTNKCLIKLADLYVRKADYKNAVDLLQRALVIAERGKERDHLDNCIILEELANVLLKQSDHKEAIKLYRRILKVQEKNLDPLNLSIAITLNKLALLLEETEGQDDAETLYHKSLEIIEHVLGTNHPLTAASLSNLARVSCQKKEYSKAESLCRRALRVRKRILNKKHPDLLISLSALADILAKQGDSNKSEKIRLRVQKLERQTAFPRHTDTLSGSGMTCRLHNIDPFEEISILFKEMNRINTGIQHRYNSTNYSINCVWADFFGTRSNHCRDLLVKHYLPLVEYPARRIFVLVQRELDKVPFRLSYFSCLRQSVFLGIERL